MYKITITEVTTVRKSVDEWQKMFDAPSVATLQQVPTGQYAYATHEKDVEVSREVLRQEVLTLDVAAVIRAVNGL